MLFAHLLTRRKPLSDYVGDQTSVLDQAVRVLQAFVDALAELDMPAACLAAMTLLQCVKSARWPSDPPLSILPGVPSSSSTTTTAATDPSTAPQTLAAAASTPPSSAHALAASLGVPAAQRARFAKALAALPDLQVSAGDDASATTALGFAVTLRRRNPLAQREGRMYAPRYPKPQTEGFFVLVTDAGTGACLALKRAGWASVATSGGGRGGGGGSARPSVRVAVKLLPSPEARRVSVAVVSDGYVGMQWSVGDVEMPAAPVVPPDEGKKKKEEGQGES